MKIRNVSQRVSTVTLKLLVFTCFAGVAAADSVNFVPANAAETSMISRVIEQIKASVPPIEGWTQTIDISAAGHPVRDGARLMVSENARNYPVYISIRFDFQEITAAEKQKEAGEKSTGERQQKTEQELLQDMMAAAASGDSQQLEKIGRQITAMAEAQLAAVPTDMSTDMRPEIPAEKPAEFYVQVKVNAGSETIGKMYDIVVPGVTKAFRIDGASGDMRTYKYHLGTWQVSESGAKNWKIDIPASDRVAANYLRTLVLFALVRGDKDSVEAYVSNAMDLQGLQNVLD